ncbi:hypothetical protein AB205_0117410 [Aquarana catesbeiana]|uniref:Uncharacterized protein n=1 Tax=Aquarana catesbeiana TaxID=8400 RepID=A0A2G9SCT1_AQUCT|nr:hypothetical protein AB205_0117410 [Aquarana catesbeiana]
MSMFSLFLSVQLPEWACAVQLAVHPERGSDLLQFYLESPVCRPITFAYSVLENTLSIEADHAIGKNETCQVFRLKAKSKDGTLIPITVFCEAGDGLTQRPLLVHVYGAYGMDLNMNFKAENKLLVEDGWILAFCHVSRLYAPPLIEAQFVAVLNHELFPPPRVQRA